jgi:Glucodextranase, domain B
MVLSFGILASFVMSSGKILADSAKLISAPTGTIVNGWYTGHPTVQVQAICSGSPTGNVFTMDIAGWSWSGGGVKPEQALPGKHYIELLSNDNSNLYTNNDGTLSPYLAGGCSNPDGSSPTTVLWQGYIQWDSTNPTVSISTPTNNTNTANSTIQVLGTVSDAGSGVQSITVNGMNASISGNSFSVAIPLVMGINSLQATATSNSGQSSQSSSVTVFRYELASSANSSTNDSIGTNSVKDSSTTRPGNNNTSGNPTAGASASNAKAATTLSTSVSTPAKAKAATKPSTPISTPIKAGVAVGVVIGTGLAVASYLGFIPYKRIGLFVAKFLLK